VPKRGYWDPEERARIAALASRRLEEAFDQGRLTLYLGAGCSVASDIPTWDRLVTRLYINGIVRKLPRFTSVPGLVSAVGTRPLRDKFCHLR